jgi:superfamily II DNA or RNA helicase
MIVFDNSERTYDRGLIRVEFCEWRRLVEQGIDKRLVAQTKTDYGSSSFNVWYDTGSSILIPRGVADMEDVHLPYAPREWNTFGTAIPFAGTLRTKQEGPVARVLECLSHLSGVTLQAACGSGKTIMALRILSEMRPKQTIVLVDQLDIALQWREQIQAFLPGCTIQVLGGESQIQQVDFIADVLIVVAQSLMRRLWINNPLVCDLLIVDEAHVFSAPCFAASICNIDFAKSIALTATPDRKDGLAWVFHSILGEEIVKADTSALTARVFTFELSFVPESVGDYYMAWCHSKKGMTWKSKCRTCPKFSSFPGSCGGGLPLKMGRVVWGTKLNVTSLQTAVAMNTEYIDWLHTTIGHLLEKGRQILVFSGYRAHLDVLYTMGVRDFGIDRCGLFVGKAGKTAEKNRETAMKKQVTYCTFGVANKALDVPHKDTAFYTTQISDVRQAKGRIERIVPGKSEPWIIDVNHTNIPIFRAMAHKRRKLYNEYGCQITKLVVQPPSQSQLQKS